MEIKQSFAYVEIRNAELNGVQNASFQVAIGGLEFFFFYFAYLFLRILGISRKIY